MGELSARLERHFNFSTDELMMLGTTAFIAAFGVPLSLGWGIFNIFQEQTPANYISNLAVVFIMFFIALLLHFGVQKIIALKLGYTTRYRSWKLGYVISIFLCFVTFGFLPILFTGSLWPTVEKKLRIGRFRSGVMHKDIGIISFSGPLFSVLVALVSGFFYVAVSQTPLVFAFISANLLVAIYSLIPLANFGEQGGTTGLYLFIASRWVYVLALSFVITFSLLVFAAKIFSLVIAAIIAIFVTVLYYNAYESN